MLYINPNDFKRTRVVKMKDKELDKVELLISKFLRFGVIISALFVLLGLTLFLFTGYSGYDGETFPTTIHDILTGFISLKPYGIINVGLILLILTPVFRVAVSIIVFIKAKDYLYAKITSLVLFILILSFSLGKVG